MDPCVGEGVPATHVAGGEFSGGKNALPLRRRIRRSRSPRRPSRCRDAGHAGRRKCHVTPHRRPLPESRHQQVGGSISAHPVGDAVTVATDCVGDGKLEPADVGNRPARREVDRGSAAAQRPRGSHGATADHAEQQRQPGTRSATRRQRSAVQTWQLHRTSDASCRECSLAKRCQTPVGGESSSSLGTW